MNDGDPYQKDGLYSVFTLFVALHLAFFVVMGISQAVYPPPPLYDVGGMVEPFHLPVHTVFGAVVTAFLLAFLSWTPLRKELGSWHLPVALLLATLGPLLVEYLSDFAAVQRYLSLDISARQWDGPHMRQLLSSAQLQTSISLLIPLILVSWRYRFRVVLMYCFLLVACGAGIIFALPVDNFLRFDYASLILFRTLFFIFTGYVISRLATGQRAKNFELEAANQRLSQYAGVMEQLAISRERNRLAREMHDTLAHTLSSVAVQLEAVSTLWRPQPERAREILRQSLVNTREGLVETRRVIQSLRATPLEEMGLLMALKNLVNTFEDRNNISVQLQVDDRQLALNPEVEQNIYRIAEEALNNIASHARANRVTVKFLMREKTLMLDIRDDGVGFNIDQCIDDGHYGLRGMRERAGMMRAQLDVSSDETGTCVHLEMEVE